MRPVRVPNNLIDVSNVFRRRARRSRVTARRLFPVTEFPQLRELPAKLAALLMKPIRDLANAHETEGKPHKCEVRTGSGSSDCGHRDADSDHHGTRDGRPPVVNGFEIVCGHGRQAFSAELLSGIVGDSLTE